MDEFTRKQNLYAGVREYLIAFTINLTIATASSIRLQASSLSQLTQSTNQLTRASAVMAASKSLQLARSLRSMATRVPAEDVQRAAKEIAACLSNLLTVRSFPSYA
jgi:hypothetical protein